jgi:hypothetical protein
MVEYILRLAKEDEFEKALDLAKRLFAIKKAVENDGGGIKVFFDNYGYQEELKKIISIFMELNWEKSLDMVICLLHHCLKHSYNSKEILVNDHSTVWMEAIEHHCPQKHFGSIEEDLLCSIVKLAEEYMPTNGNAILAKFGKEQFSVFIRISMYLRSQFPEVDLEKTAEIITNPEVWDTYALKHEYYLILKNCFGHLNAKEHETYFRKANYRRKVIEKYYGSDLTDEEFKEIKEYASCVSNEPN